MLILFPNHPIRIRDVDSDYAGEATAAQAAGFQVGVVEHDRLCQGDVERALRFINPGQGPCLYRGWMMTAGQDAAMYAGLVVRGYHPITEPRQYDFCHHLPENYSLIEQFTPATAWITTDAAGIPLATDWGAIAATSARVGQGACIVKDWVKSQKHAWSTACFIPDSQDGEAIRRIAGRFLELQGDLLTGGLVFRRFIPLGIIKNHPRSGMPLGAEVRTFWFRGNPVLTIPYWEEAPIVELPSLAPFTTVVASIPSPFFTMDIARDANGSWFIMELGDGQVAGLPTPAATEQLYAALATTMKIP